MKKNRLDELKQEYMNTEIPEELEVVVRKSISRARREHRKGKHIKSLKTISVSAAASIIIFTVAINASPVLADTMQKVPLIGSIVNVLTINEIVVREDGYDADIETPAIEGLENEKFQSSLNERYIEENKQLYNEFIAEMEDLEDNGGGHLGVDSGYEVKTDNDRILSIGHYVVNTAASSSTKFKYDTIDKKNEILITLSSLFVDDSYIEIISENIKKQMLEKNDKDDYNYYWVEGIEQSAPIELFDKISDEQSFYINDEYNLVISFDKYEVAPGYMGMVEFTIPSEILSEILVSDEYIK